MAKGIYKGHYDPSRILNAKDRTGKQPEVIFVCSRGRSLGKTFGFSRFAYERAMGKTFGYEIEKHLTGSRKFVLFTRYKKELGSVAAGILKGYLEYARPETTVYEKKQMSGTFSNIYATYGFGDEAETEHIGYVIPLAADDEIKKISSLFVDVELCLFDEFQPTHNSTYLRDEVDRLVSIHTSLARGGGRSVRFLPVILLSNTINIFNPYFIQTGLVRNIQPNTRLHVGDGLIYERCMVIGNAQEHAGSAFNQVFSASQLLNYDDDNSWLAADNSLVSKPDGWGRSEYYGTLLSGQSKYGVKYYPGPAMYYVDRRPDLQSPRVYNITVDGNLNVPFIRGSSLIKSLKSHFMAGLVRVCDNGVKDMLLDLFI